GRAALPRRPPAGLSTPGPGPAAAQCGVGSPPQLCAAGAGDCAITAADCTITLPAGGLVINLGARRLVLTKNLKVNGPPGASLTVNAGDVLMTGGSIVAPGAADLSGFVTAGNVTILSATNLTVPNRTPFHVRSR